LNLDRRHITLRNDPAKAHLAIPRLAHLCVMIRGPISVPNTAS
jgi:hypothetical protein